MTQALYNCHLIVTKKCVLYQRQPVIMGEKEGER